MTLTTLEVSCMTLSGLHGKMPWTIAYSCTTVQLYESTVRCDARLPNYQGPCAQGYPHANLNHNLENTGEPHVPVGGTHKTHLQLYSYVQLYYVPLSIVYGNRDPCIPCTYLSYLSYRLLLYLGIL